MLVYSSQDDSLRRLAGLCLQGLRRMASNEPWARPLQLWLEHIQRQEIPYVPYLLNAGDLVATYFETVL